MHIVVMRIEFANVECQDLTTMSWCSILRRSHRRCSVKKVFLKISQISPENTCVGVPFLVKKIPAQVFPCKICEIFKNTCKEAANNCFCILLYLWERLSAASSAVLHVSVTSWYRRSYCPKNVTTISNSIQKEIFIQNFSCMKGKIKWVFEFTQTFKMGCSFAFMNSRVEVGKK